MRQTTDRLRRNSQAQQGTQLTASDRVLTTDKQTGPVARLLTAAGQMQTSRIDPAARAGLLHCRETDNR